MNWYRKATKTSEEIDAELIRDLDKSMPEWVSVDSSFIKEVRYFERPRILEIRFKNGIRYNYGGVPKRVYQNLLKAKSKGEFFNRVIRKRYPALAP